MGDDDLFSPKPVWAGEVTTAYARSSDPWTSHAAADGVRLTKRQQQVYDAVCATPLGLNEEECAKKTGIKLNTVGPRFKPLEELSLIVRNGTRIASSGCNQTVWIKAPPGHVYVAPPKKFKWTDKKVIEFCELILDSDAEGRYFGLASALKDFKGE